MKTHTTLPKIMALLQLTSCRTALLVQALYPLSSMSVPYVLNIAQKTHFYSMLMLEDREISTKAFPFGKALYNTQPPQP